MLRTLLVLLVAVTQTQDAPRRDTRASQPAPASISGRIIERETGEPLPRAVVTLLSADRSRHLEAVADDGGRYELTGLDAGEYAIFAGPPELRATHLRQVFGRPEPMEALALPAANIELKADEARTGVDFTLTRAMAIEGRVLDPWDEPMSSVEVRLIRMNGTQTSISASSDDRGVFRLFRIPPGRYRVCAVASSRFVDAPAVDNSRFVRTCHPASVTEAGASDVVLTTGDVSGIDIRMQRLGAYTVSGTVLDANGRPVDGSHVGAYSLDPTISAHTTSSSGQFVLRGLIPGRYLVTGAVGGSPDPERRMAGRELEMGFAHVDVSGTDVSGLTIPLSTSQTLTGRVVFEGTPVPAPKLLRMVIQTRPLPEHRRAIGSRLPFSAVEDTLKFAVAGLFRLPLIVGISGQPDGWALKAVRYDNRDISGIATDLGNRAAPRRLEIVLTNRVASPAVRVIDDIGQPVTTYRLVVLPADPARWKGASWFSDGLPSRDGISKLGARVPGEYLIAALGSSDVSILWESAARLDRVAEIATRVTLTEGDNRTIDLQLVTLPPEIR